MEIEIPIGREDCHCIQKSDEGDRSGRLNGDADTILSTRGTFREALEEEDEHASEERGLDEAVEEDLVESTSTVSESGLRFSNTVRVHTSLFRQRFFQCRSRTTGRAIRILVVPSPRLITAPFSPADDPSPADSGESSRTSVFPR